MPIPDGPFLVAIDIRGESIEAIREALRLRALVGREVHVLHALAAGDDAEGRRASAAKQIDAWLDEAVTDGNRPAVHIQEGEPVATILAQVDALGAALLVLGSHGTGEARTFLGKTANTLVRDAPCPVVVQHRPMLEHAPLLISLDADAPGDADQLKGYAALARALDTSVLLHQTG